MKNVTKYGKAFLVFIVIANITVLRYKVTLLAEKIAKLESKLNKWDGD